MMPKDDLGVPTMIINRIPKKTHYANQYAIVTIYDPVMKQLEYIPKSDRRRNRNFMPGKYDV